MSPGPNGTESTFDGLSCDSGNSSPRPPRHPEGAERGPGGGAGRVAMTAAQREKLRESLEDFVETGLEFGLGARGSSSGTTPEKVRRSEEARRSQQQEVRQVAVSTAHLSPRKCEVNVDYGEPYDPDTAALQGRAVMTTEQVLGQWFLFSYFYSFIQSFLNVLTQHFRP